MNISQNCNFIAIDFETATCARHSICEIGIAVVKNAEIIDSKSWLVQPPNNEYDEFNISIHGITPSMTKYRQCFDEVWKEVLPYLDGQIVVSHNTAFDMYVLKDALDINNIPYPHLDYYCTYRLAKYIYRSLYSYSLETLCYELNIKQERHHRAESDAIAAANLMLEMLDKECCISFDELEEKFSFRHGEFSDNYFCPQKSTRAHASKKKASNFIGDPSKRDANNFFFEKEVCITGKCSYGVRDDLFQLIADIGGYPANNVTKTTDVLVVGQQDYRVVGEEGISSKQRKAMKLKDSGQDIEIMSEADFLLTIGTI